MWVVHLKNADATKLATVLRAAFAAGGSGGGAGGASNVSGTTPTSSPLGVNPPATCGHRRIAAGDGSGHALGGAIDRRLHPGRSGDQLAHHHRAGAAVPRRCATMIDQLDDRRAQVYIESLIVEVERRQGRRLRLPVAGPDLEQRTTTTRSSAAPTSAPLATCSAITAAQIASGSTPAAPPAQPEPASALLGEGLNVGIVHNFFGTYVLAAIARLLQSQTQQQHASTPEPGDAGQRGSQDRSSAERAVRDRPVHPDRHGRRASTRSRRSSARTSASRCASGRRSARTARCG